MFFNRNKKNNVHPCKPQFYYIILGFKGVKIIIMKIRLYNIDPLKPQFYTVKLGFTGVYIIFHISAQNIDCDYSLELPCWGVLMSTHNVYFEQKCKNISFLSENFQFLKVKFLYIWIGMFS